MDILKGSKMKFKPIYLYGVVLAAAVVLLIFFSRSKDSNPDPETTNLQNENIPDDDIHNQLKMQESNPTKDNVTENFHKRMGELKQAVENNPNDTLKLKEYADFLAAAHKTEEAIRMYDRILKINPKRTDIYFSITLLYYNEKDLQKAEEYNEKVLMYDPTNSMALYNRGALAATRGDKEKARTIWEKIVKDDPDSEVGNLAKQSLTRL
jgi:tetratricopeptide (TPR) repeat protein